MKFKVSSIIGGKLYGPNDKLPDKIVFKNSVISNILHNVISRQENKTA